MLIDALRILIGLLGITVCILSFWAMVEPTRLITLARRFTHDGNGFWVAVVGRILLGVVMVYVAPATRFPTLFEVIGWLALIAGVGLAAIGRERLGRIIGWFERLPAAVIRLWLVFAITFGAFLVVGVV